MFNSISKSAIAIMSVLTNDLNEDNRARTIDNNKSFMPVHIEFLHTTEEGDFFCVNHTYEQNGDLMRDPEVVFLRVKTNNITLFLPVSFQQDNLGIYREHVEYDENGKINGVYTALLKDCASFCNMWMKNIKFQQGL